MGTRTMVRSNRKGSEEQERRIQQVEVRRELVDPSSVSVTGHGISVIRSMQQLQAGDRILALNNVSVEKVSLDTFWKILCSNRGLIQIIISRPLLLN